MSFGPVQTKNGEVIQGGLNPTTQGEAPRQQIFGKWRAVVLETYPPDHSSSRSKSAVECDVILVRNNILLRNVPVMQREHGVQDAQPWVPKGSTRSTGLPLPVNLTLRGPGGRFIGPTTRLDQLDGDHVLVEYLEGDPDMPAVVGAWTHRQTNRQIVTGSGWSSGSFQHGEPHSAEHYRGHAGTEVRINDEGDWLLNTEGANPIDPIAEIPNPLIGGKGQINLKPGQSLIVSSGGENVVEVVRSVAGTALIRFGGTAFMPVALAPLVLQELAKIPVGVTAAIATLSGPAATPATNAEVIAAFTALGNALQFTVPAATKVVAE